MSTINTITNTNIANNLFEDIFGVFGTEAFAKTYVDVYKKASTNTIFTLRHWRVLKEIFRDSKMKEQENIFSLLGRDYITFPYAHNGDEDYMVDNFYQNGDRDDYHHGCEGWVVEED